MNLSYAKLKLRIRKLFEGKEKFSLVKLMSDVEVCLTESTSSVLSGVRSRGLVEPYLKKISDLLSSYILNKKLTKNPVRRKNLRKEAAKNFFEILGSLSIKVYRWLPALPERLQEECFEAWKKETENGENKDLVKYVKDAGQVERLRESLLAIKYLLEDTADNRKLKKLVMDDVKR